MMTKNKSRREETKHSSLIVRWVAVVSLTIMVSFIIFSVVIYSTVRQQTLSQQEQVTDKVVQTLNDNLKTINSELQISTVVPSLSPATRQIMNGGPNIKGQNNAFSDQLISSISNPDISVAVYNKHNEVVFANGNSTPAYHAFKGQIKYEKKQRGRNAVLLTYSRVRSAHTGKTTGYIVVSNRMSYYNNLMHNLLGWMVIISLVSIIVFVIITYFIVSDVVKPIKEISGVARKVNHDPNSSARIKELHRNDELEELATSFNRMLDRMQSYIEQQKQFVSDVSHELRTPVAVIEGHLNMLQRWGKDDPKILNESISASLQEADRMKHLIQEMLDLTRAEQIDVQYPNAVSDVLSVVKRVVGDMRLVHKDFLIQLDAGDLPAKTKIQIYQGHLEQLLIILIDNAIKYSTDRKQINISVGANRDWVRLIVQDFGEGIAPEEQSKIFNRFYRVDKARTREKGGNGLGLAIAQKLVASYHGKIGVESVLGQGSQFILSFPLLSDKEAKRLNKLAEANNSEYKPAGII